MSIQPPANGHGDSAPVGFEILTDQFGDPLPFYGRVDLDPAFARLNVVLARAFFGASLIVALLTFTGLIFASGYLGVLAAQAPAGSLQQGMYVELAAGIGLFIVAPAVFAFAEWARPVSVVATALATSALSLAVASGTSGIWQSFFLEASVGILLLLALEHAVHRWLRAVYGALREARMELAVARRKIKELDS